MKTLKRLSKKATFQFLLVRLKDYCFDLWLLVYKISIPSGAIKSLNSLKEIDFVIPFQFLLVRLKVLLVFNKKPPLNLISIPSGAIKRVKPEYDIRTDRLFQFLLVRLKATDEQANLLLDTNFNSFWCD